MTCWLLACVSLTDRLSTDNFNGVAAARGTCAAKEAQGNKIGFGEVLVAESNISDGPCSGAGVSDDEDHKEAFAREGLYPILFHRALIEAVLCFVLASCIVWK